MGPNVYLWEKDLTLTAIIFQYVQPKFTGFLPIFGKLSHDASSILPIFGNKRILSESHLLRCPHWGQQVDTPPYQ